MNTILQAVPVFAVHYMCTPVLWQDGFGKVVCVFSMDQDSLVFLMLIVMGMMEQVVALQSPCKSRKSRIYTTNESLDKVNRTLSMQNNCL